MSLFDRAGNFAKGSRLLFVVFLIMVLLEPVCILGGAPASSNTNELRPPRGARIAIVVFEDLACPGCASSYDDLDKAARDYHVPLVHVEYPLPAHPWAKQASILARFFDSKSLVLGRQFRKFIFSQQASIGPHTLRSVAEHFAAAHNIQLPFVIDPDKQFEQAVQSDIELAQRIGVQQTPAVYVVQRGASPPVEVNDAQALEKLLRRLSKGQKLRTAGL